MYGYEIIAVNGSGTSLFAGPLTATTPIPPGAATNFAESSATTTSIALTWTAAAGATGYQIYRQSVGGMPVLLASLAGSATSYLDSGLSAGATYQYILTASNVSGTGGSRLRHHRVDDQCAPAPAAIYATSSVGQATLTWASATGAATYSIYRGTTTAGGESATPIALGISGTTYIDTGLSAGTTYYYIVRAVNGAGTSAASSEASTVAPITVARRLRYSASPHPPVKYCLHGPAARHADQLQRLSLHAGRRRS